MPKKNKGKVKHATRSSATLQNFLNYENAEIFRNSFAVGDDTDPHESLKYMKEMFSGKLDEDVIVMIFSECAYNVDQALETLIALSNDSDNQTAPLNQESTSVELYKKNFFPQYYYSSPTSSASFYNNTESVCEWKQGDLFETQQLSSVGKDNEVGCSFLENVNCQNSKHLVESKETNDLILQNGVNKEFTSQLLSQNYTFQDYSKKSLRVINSSDTSSRMPINIIKNSKVFLPKNLFNKSISNMGRGSALPRSHAASPLLYTSCGTSPYAPQFITPVLSVQNINTSKSFSSKSTGAGNSTSSSKRESDNIDDVQYTVQINNIIQKIKNGEKVMVILRGLPGSGKSLLAQQLKFSGVVLSSDDYFWKKGKYCFDWTKLNEAHEWNRKRAVKALRKSITPVIIDNTNTQRWEMKPYIMLGIRSKYKIYILEPNTPWKFDPGELAKRNVHNVSKETIERMLERYEHNITIDKIVSVSGNKYTVTCDKNKTRGLSEMPTVPRSSNFSSSFNNHDVSADLLSNCNSINPNTTLPVENKVSESINNSNLISLEVDVHREDEANSVLSWQDVSDSNNKSLWDTNNKTDNSNDKSLLWHTDNSSESKSSESELVETIDHDDNNSIKDLNDLKMLTLQDTDESQSLSCASASDSYQDIVGWEMITEKDDDFCWSLDVQHKDYKLSEWNQNEGSSDSLNKLNDFKSNTSIDNLSKEFSPEQEIYETKDFTDKIQEFHNDCNLNEQKSEESNKIQEFHNDCNLNEQKSEESNTICNTLPRENMSEMNSFNNLKYDSTNNCLKINEINMSYTDDLKYKMNNDGNNSSMYDWVCTDNETARRSWEVTENTIELQDDKKQFSTPLPQRVMPVSYNKHSKWGNSHTYLGINSFTTNGENNFIDKKNEYLVERESQELGIKRTDGYLNLQSHSNVLNIDWNLPIMDLNSASKKVEHFKSFAQVFSKETQTDPSDFVLLHKIVSNDLYISDMKVLVPSNRDLNYSKNYNAENHILKNRIARVVCFDKSSDTSDIPETIEYEEKLEMLCSCFPDISIEDLKHLLDMCHGDNTWLSSILLEWGYKYNIQNASSDQCLALDYQLMIVEESDLKQNNDDTVTSIFENSTTNSVPESEVVAEPTKISTIENQESASLIPASENEVLISDNSNDKQNMPDTSQTLCLTLDTAFALKLEELFGPINDCQKDLEVSENRTVEIGISLAKLLYDQWKGFVDNKLSENKNNCMDSISNKCGVNALSETNSRFDADTFSPKPIIYSTPKCHNEPVSLSEIMDMEYALELHKQEKTKIKSEKDKDVASKLKRLKLYQMFPGVDTIALDEVFESNNCSMTNTLFALEEDVGKPAKLHDEFSVEELDEEHLWKKSDIYQDFIKEDWLDWVHPDSLLTYKEEEEIPEVSSYITPETERLRDEANMHYYMRQEYVSKAQSAYCRGMKNVASFYAQKGQFHLGEFKRANTEAARIIIENKNYSSNSSILDLHGLYVQEAIPALERFLNLKKEELKSRSFADTSTISVVTGRGSHSVRTPKLRPAVISYLKSTGYSYGEANVGVFNVTLNGR